MFAFDNSTGRFGSSSTYQILLPDMINCYIKIQNVAHKFEVTPLLELNLLAQGVKENVRMRERERVH